MCENKVLTLDNIATSIKVMEFAICGPISQKAGVIRQALKEGKEYPFKKLTPLNVGNPHDVGQPPIAFNRSVMACLLDTKLIDNPLINPDIRKRAAEYLKHVKSIGAQTECQGMEYIRQNIANYIEERDGGIKADKDNIYITNGTGDGVKKIIEMLLNDKNDGMMIPVPRYPQYSADIQLKEGKMVGYYLDESKDWQLPIDELKKSYDEAIKQGIRIKALSVINPGNPTGAILEENNIQEIFKFCFERSILVMADEVYQENIYTDDKKFHSFKKVLMKMGEPYSNNQELLSFHSISKGIQGECGLRGGYIEFVNIEKEALQEFENVKSIEICPNTMGQVAIDLMINRPTVLKGYSEETVKEYEAERSKLFGSLKKRAKIVTQYLRQCNNLSTNEIEGAMYAFPTIKFSQKAIEYAKKEGIVPDFYYCCCCLEETGIILVPGSGFGQAEGTHHFRITILLYDPEELEEIMKKFKVFNDNFHKRFE